jgi:hypothetical protein
MMARSICRGPWTNPNRRIKPTIAAFDGPHEAVDLQTLLGCLTQHGPHQRGPNASPLPVGAYQHGNFCSPHVVFCQVCHPDQALRAKSAKNHRAVTARKCHQV